MKLPIVILAGGLATRLRPITEQIPKVLVEVAGQPFAAHQLALLRRHGFERVVLCVGHLGEQVQAVLGDGQRWNMQITYVFDGPQLLGTGGAIRRALPVLDDAFFVLYGDSYLECDYQAVEAAFLASEALGLMTVLQNANRWDRSNVIYQDGRIVHYNKHEPTPAMQHIDYGLSVFKRAVFVDYAADQALDLAVIQRNLVQQGQMIGFEVAQRFYEIGSHVGLQELRHYLAQQGQAV